MAKNTTSTKPSTITEAKKILKSQTIPHSYYSSLANSTNTTSRNTNRNSISSFGHAQVNYFSFRTAESTRVNSNMYINSRPANRYSAGSYTPSYSYRLENRHKHYSLRDSPRSSSMGMKTSITLPAISSRNVSESTPVYSSQKSSFSSYAIRSVDGLGYLVLTRHWHLEKI
jgi:hypothetical protein